MGRGQFQERGIGLLGGGLADIVDRRKTLMFGYGGSFLTTGLLAVLFLTDNLQLWHVYAITLVSSTVTVLDGPARTGLIYGSVPRSHLTNALTLASSSHQGSILIGPAVGGLLISFSGIGGAYAVTTAMYVPAMAAVLLLGDVRPAEGRSRPRLRRADLLEGLRWVGRTPIVLALTSIDFTAMVFTSYKVLLPFYALKLGVGEAGFGFLTSAPAVGFLIGSAVLLALGDVPRKGLVMAVGIVGYVASVSVFAVSPWFPMSLAALAVAGGFDGVSAIMRRTTLQLLVPDDIRGRATAVIQVFTRSTSSVGLMATGGIASIPILGPAGALLAGGVFALGALVAASLRWRQILTFRI
ncbi:MAG: MFS transporter [Planctomycetes bacterium]|nr:MFS transporter [Planctomycetota bacterium]